MYPGAVTCVDDSPVYDSTTQDHLTTTVRLRATRTGLRLYDRHAGPGSRATARPPRGHRRHLGNAHVHEELSAVLSPSQQTGRSPNDCKTFFIRVLDFSQNHMFAFLHLMDISLASTSTLRLLLYINTMFRLLMTREVLPTSVSKSKVLRRTCVYAPASLQVSFREFCRPPNRRGHSSFV